MLFESNKSVNEAIRHLKTYSKTLVELFIRYLDAFDFSQCTKIPHNRCYPLVGQVCRCSNTTLNQRLPCVWCVYHPFKIRIKFLMAAIGYE